MDPMFLSKSQVEQGYTARSVKVWHTTLYVAHDPFVEAGEAQGVERDAGRSTVIKLKFVPVAVLWILFKSLARA